MKKVDIANALREIASNEDNCKFAGFGVVTYHVHGLGNSNIRSASTICSEYSKAELEDALNYYNKTVEMHEAIEEEIEMDIQDDHEQFEEGIEVVSEIVQNLVTYLRNTGTATALSAIEAQEAMDITSDLDTFCVEVNGSYVINVVKTVEAPDTDAITLAYKEDIAIKYNNEFESELKGIFSHSRTFHLNQHFYGTLEYNSIDDNFYIALICNHPDYSSHVTGTREELNEAMDSLKAELVSAVSIIRMRQKGGVAQ